MEGTATLHVNIDAAKAALGADGTLLQCDGHYLTALDADLSLRVPGFMLGHLDRRLLPLNSGLVATRSKHSLVLIPTDLTAPADGIWSCTEGNLQGNPVHAPADYGRRH